MKYNRFFVTLINECRFLFNIISYICTMSQEQRLREMQNQAISTMNGLMQEVKLLSTTQIFSDNGLSDDQKREIHTVLMNTESTSESIAKATELLKQFTGK